MKQILQLEQLAQLALAVAGMYLVSVQVPGWLWPILFLAPDVSMVGYLLGSKAGAIAYNIAHHKMTAGVVIAIGWGIHSPVLLLAGLLLWGHSAFDRMLGYGLKYGDSFQHTHLGMIGKVKTK